MLLAEQVREPELELARGAARGQQRALERLVVVARDRLVEPGAIVGVGEAVEQARAEDALDGRAGVRDRPVGVEHHDQIARLADERAEARLATAAVELVVEDALLADEAGQPEHDQCEQADRADLDHEVVEVAGAELARHGQRGGDERRAREQDEPEARQQPLTARRRLRQACHRGMQPGHAPEDVGADPAGVEPMLVLERTVQRQHAVREVGDRQQCDGRDQRPEGGLAATRVEREPDGGAQQDHIAHGVGDRRHLGPQPDVALVQVRSDQRHPRRQRQPHREDDAVDQAAAVGAVAATPHEQQQPAHHQRVHRDVGGVAQRRERDLVPREALVVVRVQVAEPEGGAAGGEQDPGAPARRAGGGGRRSRSRRRARARARSSTRRCRSADTRRVRRSRTRDRPSRRPGDERKTRPE